MLPSSLPSSCGGDPGVTSYLTCSFSVPVCVQFESSVTEAALHFVHRTRQHARRGVLACKLYRGISLVSNWDVVQLYTCLSPTQRQKDKHLRRYTREVKTVFFSLHVVLQLQLHFCYNVCKASCSLVWCCPCWRPKQQLPEQEVNPGLSAAFRSIETCPD